MNHHTPSAGLLPRRRGRVHAAQVGNAGAHVFRGTDGYDYVIKSNSWTGGGLSFGTSTASFSGKCNVTAINPSTGLAVSGIGGSNYTYRVDVTDNGSTGDTYAISVYTSTGTLYHQAGTTGSQIPLGGGNIVIHTQ